MIWKESANLRAILHVVVGETLDIILPAFPLFHPQRLSVRAGGVTISTLSPPSPARSTSFCYCLDRP